jgi:arylformamidase
MSTPMSESHAREPDPATTDAASPAGGAPPRSRIVDLSHDIRAGLVTYPGLPAPVITPHLTRSASRERYAPGTEFGMDLITLIGNTGTYLDSPFHRYEEGADLAALPLESLVDLPAEVFHLTERLTAGGRGIGTEALAGRELAGSAVLLHTGWDRYFGEPAYATGAPFLTAEGARLLVEARVALVGIDSLNIDDTESGGERPAHSLLLGAGIQVVEHLTNLGELSSRGMRFTAVPPKIVGFGTFPVRAFARFP